MTHPHDKLLSAIHHKPTPHAIALSEYSGQYERVTECVGCGDVYSYYDVHYLLPPCPGCGSMTLRLRIGKWVWEKRRVPWFWKFTKMVRVGHWDLKPL